MPLQARLKAENLRDYIWDGHGDEVRYDYDQPYGIRTPRTPWQDYQEALNQARAILSAPENSSPAAS